MQLEAERHREALRIAEQDHAEALRHDGERHRAELEAKVAADQAQVAYLAELKGLGVNLTEYLVACVDKKPDKVLKVLAPGVGVGGSAAAGAVNGMLENRLFNIHTNV